MLQLHKYWDQIRSGFWFVPSLMIAGGGGLALAAVALDELVGDRWGWVRSWVYTGSAEGARTILGTIAGSMITTAGVVLSLTLVALTLASSQLGPRLLHNFRRDRAIQLVIGAFIATFLYCLLVLRTIRREDSGAFVPHFSVSLGVLFALSSLVILIYFIHHLTVSIQADEVVARVSAELARGIEKLFPEQVGEGGGDGGAKGAAEGMAQGAACGAGSSPLPASFDVEARPVASTEDGYLQMIDAGALMKLAARHDLLLELEWRPGDYVVADSPLVRAWPPARLEEGFDERINAAFVFGSRRTAAQDVQFSIDQLVEIAVRALSPGVNDPFTACTCVDRLGSALCLLAGRRMPSPHRRDEEGALRVVAPADTFPRFVEGAFDQIRQAARSNAAVTNRLLETIAVVGGRARRPDDRAALRRQAEMIMRGAREALPEEGDRRAAEERFEGARRALGGG